jgi:hypothetical protein
MNNLLLSTTSTGNHFTVDYPYYGLFNSADVTPMSDNKEEVYQCRLLNGSIILLKKLMQPKKWIDANLNTETPLSYVIGMSIEDFLRFHKQN